MIIQWLYLCYTYIDVGDKRSKDVTDIDEVENKTKSASISSLQQPCITQALFSIERSMAKRQLILSWTALGWYQFLYQEINRRFIRSRVSLFAFEYFSEQLSQIFCMILCVYYFSGAEMIESNRKLQKIRYRSVLEHISHQKSGVELGRFFNLRIFLGRFSYAKRFLILS